MLIFDFHTIGNKLYAIRKQTGMTQAEVAEAAGVSDRTYADIERGSVNMRIETVLRICNTLHVTPDEILTEDKVTGAQVAVYAGNETLLISNANGPYQVLKGNTAKLQLWKSFLVSTPVTSKIALIVSAFFCMISQ